MSQVGVGGSGRQSLTRLAAFMCGLKVLTIEVCHPYSHADWRADLRTALREAGEKARPAVFLLSDAQLKEESFLEDLNSILNAGDVRSLALYFAESACSVRTCHYCPHIYTYS